MGIWVTGLDGGGPVGCRAEVQCAGGPRVRVADVRGGVVSWGIASLSHL